MTAPRRRAVELHISVVDSIAQVDQADWDACANPNATGANRLQSHLDKCESALPAWPRFRFRDRL